MRISTKGRYGLRVMVELAMQNIKGPTMMSTLAKNQGISRKYLHSLLTTLKGAGLVRSIRGAGGGYTLGRTPDSILVSEIVRSLEGSFLPVECVGNSSLCKRSKQCATRDLWTELNNAVEKVLSDITLEQLAAKQKAKQAPSLMYHI